MGTCEPLIEERIAEHIRMCGSLAKAAEKLGFSRQYLSQVLNGKCPPSDNLLDKLGLVRATIKKKKT